MIVASTGRATMRDILLHIDTYAEPISFGAIEQAVGFAAMLDCPIAGLATHIDINVPDNWLAERLLHISDLASVEEDKSVETGRAALKHLAEVSAAAGVQQEGIILRAHLHGVPACVARAARTRDLCLVPIGDRADPQRVVAEDVIFGAGRPVLVFNPKKATLPTIRPRKIAIAWDGSRCSARAVSDAIPILKKAEMVRILTVTGEKPSAIPGMAANLVRHLGAHDIAAGIDEVDGRHRSIGASIDAYIDVNSPDLLVMGGYGTAKLKEFVLGGATEHVLNDLKVATLLSH
jgi:nucleotide-binding universal stress UspA family protein